MISYVCLFLIMPAGVSRRAAVFMNRDGVARGALFRDVARTLVNAVLVDAGLVLEGVGPHNSLVGLDGHARVLLDHVARGRDVDGVDARPQVRTAAGRALRPEVRRAFQGQSHHYLF